MQLRKGDDMKEKLIAFDDNQLSDWLMDVIAHGSDNFLCSLAEAVVTANAEDYSVIRPGLIELKRKYCDGDRRRVPDPCLLPGTEERTETWSLRSQTP
jgi:hypothetical protein